jgi:hypothetical protein
MDIGVPPRDKKSDGMTTIRLNIRFLINLILLFPVKILGMSYSDPPGRIILEQKNLKNLHGQ